MKRSLGVIVLQIALAFFLIVNGVWGLWGAGDKLFPEITAYFNGGAKTIIVLAFAISALIAGVFLLIQLISGSLTISDIILFIFMILWIAKIVLLIISTVNTVFSSAPSFLNFLYDLSRQLLVLGAIIVSHNRFK